MPKKILLIALINLLFLSAGLSAHSPDLASIEGRIQTAGPSIYMEGSHELLDAEGETVARLSGLEHKVELAEYEGKWVKVCGEWRPTVEGGGQIMEVRYVTATESVPSQP